MATRPKYLSLQAGRGLAALLVVVQHGAYMLGGPGSPAWQSSRWFAALHGTELGVEFFFVLSGMVILIAHWRDLGKPSALPSYLWKRFRRIFPVYWSVFIPWVVLRFFHAGSRDYLGSVVPLLLSNFFLLHLPGVTPVLAPAWTLFHEVWFYLVFSLLLLHRLLGTLCLSLWFAVSLFFVLYSPATEIHFFSRLHLLFGVGMLAAWLQRRETLKGPVPFYAGCLVFVGCVVFESRIPQVDLISGVAAAMILLGGMEMERRRVLRIPQRLVFFGDASYAIYLIHYPVIVSVGRLLFRLTKNTQLPLWIDLVIMCVVSTFAGVLGHLYIELPLLRWLGSFPRTLNAKDTR